MIESTPHSPSAFTRIADCFNRLPADERPRWGDVRRLALSDGTTISILAIRQGSSDPINAYRFDCNPFGRSGTISLTDYQSFGFKISEDGYENLSIPEQRLQVADITVGQAPWGMMQSTFLTKEDRHRVEEKLIDWVEKIMKEDRYTPPPISISLFRAQAPLEMAKPEVESGIPTDPEEILGSEH